MINKVDFMIKMRLSGKEEDVTKVLSSLHKIRDIRILTISKSYQNRNSTFIRKYLDVELIEHE